MFNKLYGTDDHERKLIRGRLESLKVRSTARIFAGNLSNLRTKRKLCFSIIRNSGIWGLDREGEPVHPRHGPIRIAAMTIHFLEALGRERA